MTCRVDVALRKESVDRNLNAVQIVIVVVVALRKESVDRNNIRIAPIDSIIDVALRKESVDRNPPVDTSSVKESESLSARRAWIEIPAGCWRDARRVSLSARRAWIEISGIRCKASETVVALRKESVDRN